MYRNFLLLVIGLVAAIGSVSCSFALPILQDGVMEKRDFVSVRVSGHKGSTDVIELTTKDKSSTIKLSEHGLMIDGKLLCDWSRQKGDDLPGPLGMEYVKGQYIDSKTLPCPKDSPILSGYAIGYTPESVEATPFTVIHITAIKDGNVEVPYRGKIYAGNFSQGNYTVVPAKGSSIERQVKAEKRALIEDRNNALTKMGLNKTREAIAGCLAPKLQSAECLKAHLPGSKEKFALSLFGEEKLSLEQVYAKLKEEEDDFRKDFEQCASSFGPKFDDDKNGNIGIIFDDEAEMYWTCEFKRQDGQWVFAGMNWAGC